MSNDSKQFFHDALTSLPAQLSQMRHHAIHLMSLAGAHTQPNGPISSVMLTIAKMPTSKRMTAMTSVIDGGNRLSP